MNSKTLFLAWIVLTSAGVLAQSSKQDQHLGTQPSKTQPAVNVAQQHETAGTRIFQQNCSRCHNTPEGFSPRISETVLRHMSVRASLSMRDKAELLRFLNP
jgi:cytochrome c5